MENNKSVEPTLQESEAQVAPVEAVEVVETPEQTAEKVEVTQSSAETAENVAKIEESKPGFGLKLRKGLMKAAALVGIGGALTGGASALNSDVRQEAPNTDAGTSEAFGAKDPTKDILANPALPEFLKNETKDASKDILVNPDLPAGLGGRAPESAPELSLDATGSKIENAGSETSFLPPQEYTSPITPEAATSIPTFPAEGEGVQIYNIPAPDTSNKPLDPPLPEAQGGGMNSGRVPEAPETSIK